MEFLYRTTVCWTMKLGIVTRRAVEAAVAELGITIEELRERIRVSAEEEERHAKGATLVREIVEDREKLPVYVK